jgi:hypothetical protein
VGRETFNTFLLVGLGVVRVWPVTWHYGPKWWLRGTFMKPMFFLTKKGWLIN